MNDRRDKETINERFGERMGGRQFAERMEDVLDIPDFQNGR